MKNKVITVFGAGFIGKNLIFQLLKDGYIVRAVCRKPYLSGEISLMANVGQLETVSGNIVDRNSIEDYFKTSDIVINLVGVLHESGGENYFNTHVTGPKNISYFSKKYGIEKLIHISSVGANTSSISKYQSTKGAGEEILIKNFPSAIIIRPSIVFGPGDGFYNVQSKIVKMSPIVPMFGGGQNKFQPIYIKDLVNGIMAILNNNDNQARIYEFGGPEILTMEEVYKLILKTLKINRVLIPAPIFAANFIATFLQLLPNPIITRDLVKALKFDNIISETKNTIQSLGIEPKPSELIVPTYLK